MRIPAMLPGRLRNASIWRMRSTGVSPDIRGRPLSARIVSSATMPSALMP